MGDHSIEPTMARVAVLPWPEMDGCYLVLSGAIKKRERYGDKWYAGHEEKTWKFQDEARTSPSITFTYVEDGIAAEWDGEYGPIQIWFKSHEGYEEGYDKAREHWLWPWAFGSGHWSQRAVDDADLVRCFNRGDWRHIFGELKTWVRARLPDRDASVTSIYTPAPSNAS